MHAALTWIFETADFFFLKFFFVAYITSVFY